MSWRYPLRSGYRIDANRRVLRAIQAGHRTDPELARETGLGLLRLYPALRRLRGLGMIECTRPSRWSQRRWREVDDAPEGEIVYEVEVRR